jgi:hypothetical protein
MPRKQLLFVDGEMTDRLKAGLAQPDVDVNCRAWGGTRPLHRAVTAKNYEAVRLLLAHPRIDPNAQDNIGGTPLFDACGGYCKNDEIIRVLIMDPRTEIDGRPYKKRIETLTVTEPAPTTIWTAVLGDNPTAIKWIIASGKKFNPHGNSSDEYCGRAISPLQLARAKGRHSIAELINDYLVRPDITRHEIRAELGLTSGTVPAMFAVIVFICDGLLAINPAVLGTVETIRGRGPAESPSEGSVRFLRVAVRLPLELQMVLCHIAFGSSGNTIPATESEIAFRSLARRLEAS